MKLFEPIAINDKLTLLNRIMMPPLVTRLATEEGEITKGLIDRYLLYASGGVGMVVTEAVSVKPQKSGPLLVPYWSRKYKEGCEKDLLKCTYRNACRDMDAAHEKVTCIQWKKKDGTMNPPCP